MKSMNAYKKKKRGGRKSMVKGEKEKALTEEDI